MVMNIVYSTVVACLVEVFLIANVSMISSYLRETRYRDSFFLRLTETETLMAFVYLLSGIAISQSLFLPSRSGPCAISAGSRPRFRIFPRAI